MVFFNEKFRILVAQALFASSNVKACVNVLEKDLVQENELLQGGGNISVSYINDSLTNGEKENYYRGLKNLLLAKCYESEENKVFA